MMTRLPPMLGNAFGSIAKRAAKKAAKKLQEAREEEALEKAREKVEVALGKKRHKSKGKPATKVETEATSSAQPEKKAKGTPAKHEKEALEKAPASPAEPDWSPDEPSPAEVPTPRHSRHSLPRKERKAPGAAAAAHQPWKRLSWGLLLLPLMSPWKCREMQRSQHPWEGHHTTSSLGKGKPCFKGGGG